MENGKFQKAIEEELRNLINTYEEINKNLMTMIGIREYQLNQRDAAIKLLEEEIRRLSWQFPSDN